MSAAQKFAFVFIIGPIVAVVVAFVVEMVYDMFNGEGK